MFPIRDWITRDYPNRRVVTTSSLSFLTAAFENTERLLRLTAWQIRERAGGATCVDIVAHSQGGFIARAYTQIYSGRDGYPHVRRLISLAGAQSGFYCPRSAELRKGSLFCRMLGHVPARLAYSHFAEYFITVAGYWHDPTDEAAHTRRNNMLAQLQSAGAPGRAQITGLQSFVLFATTIDGTLMPAEAAKFGFFDKNERLVGMRESDFYNNDTFGLRTLDEAGRLVIVDANSYTHKQLLTEAGFYERCLRQVLASDFANIVVGCN